MLLSVSPGLRHKDWDKADWEGVIFDDECLVEKSKDPAGDLGLSYAA